MRKVIAGDDLSSEKASGHIGAGCWLELTDSLAPRAQGRVNWPVLARAARHRSIPCHPRLNRHGLTRFPTGLAIVRGQSGRLLATEWRRHIPQSTTGR